MKIGPTGIWMNADASDHRFDSGLADAIIAYLVDRAGSVLDVGCGIGDYVRALQAAGIKCAGYDGNPNTRKITGGLCGVADFTCSVAGLPVYDWVLCLEVGEHIPPEYEADFIHNLHTHNRRGVILSWAIPGQGGVGHFNEHSNADVKTIFERLGYRNNLEAERVMRAAVANCAWFHDTIMVFERE